MARRWILRRVLGALPLLLGVLTLTFVLLETAPGSPVDFWVGDRPMPPEVRERIETAYGLDRPAPERYARWLGAVCLRGELGWSWSLSRPMSRAIAEALPNTLVLSGLALAIHTLLGIGLGAWAASRRGSRGEAASLGALVLYAMPTFWLGLMAILVLSYVVPLFPPSSMHSVDAASWSWGRRALDLLWHATLPACVLGMSSAAALARFVRAGLLETLSREFVRAARARGARGRRVLVRHALRNALLPVINLLGMSLPVLVSGSLVIEVVFAWPGMGRLTYDAIRAQDYPLVLAATLLAATLVVVGNLLADVAMAAADPRVRLGRARDS